VVAKCPEVYSLLSGVFWIDGLEESAILEIARALQPNSFAANEIMNLTETMIVIHKGMVGVKGHVLARGGVWGDSDILLDTPQLKEGAMPRTITYVEIYMLTKRSLMDVCRSFPAADRRLRRAQIRTATFRAFIRAAEKKKRVEASLARSRLGSKGSRTVSFLSTATIGTDSFNVNDSFGVGSFVHPGMNWFELSGARQGEENEVDLPELKMLILQMMHKQDTTGRDLRAVESRLDRLCTEQSKTAHTISDNTSNAVGQKTHWRFSR
jgi:hypothetical protein